MNQGPVSQPEHRSLHLFSFRREATCRIHFGGDPSPENAHRYQDTPFTKSPPRAGRRPVAIVCAVRCAQRIPSIMDSRIAVLYICLCSQLWYGLNDHGTMPGFSMRSGIHERIRTQGPSDLIASLVVRDYRTAK